MSLFPILVPATIAASGSLSAEADLGSKQLVGIAMPATGWTAASLTFQVSVDGATWLEHYNASGTETTLTAAAGQYIALDPTLWRGVTAVKVRSGTSGTPVAQVSSVTLNLVTRDVL